MQALLTHQGGRCARCTETRNVHALGAELEPDAHLSIEENPPPLASFRLGEPSSGGLEADGLGSL